LILSSHTLSTNETGLATEIVDYTPYGSIQSDDKVNEAVSDARQYIGEYYDGDTGLSYLNARYYDPGRGQFLSEDPVSWEVGQSEDGKRVLSNPQAMNSYAYAGGNPITRKDPNGKDWLTSAQGFATNVAISATLTAFILAAPITIPATVLTMAAFIGFGAVGYETYSNYQAYTSGQISKDQFDYNSGGLLGAVIPLAGLSNVAESVEGGINWSYSQKTISPRFSNEGTMSGKTLSEVISSGLIAPKDLPIDYTEVSGTRVVDNNRSSYVLEQGGIPESKWTWQLNRGDAPARILQKIQKTIFHLQAQRP